MTIMLHDPGRGVGLVRPDDHVVVTRVRNESLRLPYFLDYHRALGFDRFLLVDNASDDDTAELLLAQDDVTLFRTEAGFRASKGGMDWVESLLDAHCDGRWVMVADADELLAWPGSEHESVKALTARLDEQRADSLFTLMLDMYADRPIEEVAYSRGMPFLDATPCFDQKGYGFMKTCIFPQHIAFGGLRNRLFSEMGHDPPAASKVPLLRWRRGQSFIGSGCHCLANRMALAPMRGALFHCKMFYDAPFRCEENIKRKQHHQDAHAYRSFAAALARSRDRCFMDPRYSVRYAGTEQLVSLGLMAVDHPFEKLPGW